MPDLNSKYYTQVSGGGYNKCILGNASTNKEKNRQSKYSVLPSCVGYVYGRSLELANKTSISELPTCDATNWATYCKWEKGQTPKVGAIAVWGGNTYGHVAIVEKVNSDNSFVISESGWSSFYYRETKIGANKYYGSGLAFKCFLYNPYIKDVPKVEPKVESDSFLPSRGYWGKGDKDERVGKLCKFLHDTFPAYATKLKRNKANLLGNLYGDNCVAWVKEFQNRTVEEAYQIYGSSQSFEQFKVSYVDGYCGKQTYAMLKKYGFKY